MLPPPEPTAVVHGDLHIRHVLVDDDGAVTGVIDWATSAAPTTSSDMTLYWTLLPGPRRDPDFVAAYGCVSDAQLLRARGCWRCFSPP